MARSVKRVSAKLFSLIDPASLGMFRVLFGALMFFQALYFLLGDRYVKYYLEPAFHFSYDFFEFLKPLPDPYLQWVFILMAASAIGMMLGLLYRISTLVFLLTFTYVFLLDKAYFNNHYYAIILIAFLLLIIGGNRWASLDQKFRRRFSVIPYWHLFVLRAQILIIYFYGGIAKINGDWLRGEPMRGWLKGSSGEIPLLGGALSGEWAVYFLSYGGLLFDLSIGFLLWWRKTRLAAFLTILFFNFANGLIFHIGVFPFLMIGASILFAEPDWPRKFFGSKSGMPRPSDRDLALNRRAAWVFLGAYLGLQIVLPFRHWLYPGNVHWTEEGHFFAWHMKLRDKKGTLKYWATDPATNTTYEVDPRRGINAYQYGKLVQRPQFILQMAQHLREELEKIGIADTIIRVDSMISLNFRHFQRAIDPELDLAKAERKYFGRDTWILPLDPSLQAGALHDLEKQPILRQVNESPGDDFSSGDFL